MLQPSSYNSKFQNVIEIDKSVHYFGLMPTFEATEPTEIKSATNSQNIIHTIILDKPCAIFVHKKLLLNNVEIILRHPEAIQFAPEASLQLQDAKLVVAYSGSIPVNKLKTSGKTIIAGDRWIKGSRPRLIFRSVACLKNKGHLIFENFDIDYSCDGAYEENPKMATLTLFNTTLNLSIKRALCLESLTVLGEVEINNSLSAQEFNKADFARKMDSFVRITSSDKFLRVVKAQQRSNVSTFTLPGLEVNGMITIGKDNIPANLSLQIATSLTAQGLFVAGKQSSIRLHFAVIKYIQPQIEDEDLSYFILGQPDAIFSAKGINALLLQKNSKKINKWSKVGFSTSPIMSDKLSKIMLFEMEKQNSKEPVPTQIFKFSHFARAYYHKYSHCWFLV